MNRSWHGDRWSPVVSKAIEKRLERQRKRLAALVGLSDAHEIDSFLDDLATVLRRCWAISRDVNRAASDAQVRTTLLSLLSIREGLYDQVMVADPNTRSLIEDSWPGGQRFLENVDHSDEAALQQAIRTVLNVLPVPSRGRPKGTEDHASGELAGRLAVIYQCYSGQTPSRRVNTNTHEVYGPFHDFVVEVVNMFPACLRRYKSAPSGSAAKSVDYLVRRGVDHYRSMTSKA
jgi:hypothetical protein